MSDAKTPPVSRGSATKRDLDIITDHAASLLKESLAGREPETTQHFFHLYQGKMYRFTIQKTRFDSSLDAITD